MNVFIFYAVLSLSSSLALKVSFHTVDLIKFKYEHQPSLVCTRYEFIYHKGDTFTMYLQLANNSTRAVAVVRNELGDTYMTQAFWPEGKPLRFTPQFDKVTIDVELSVNNTCLRERIVEGRQVATGTNSTSSLEYNNICINKNECLVLVDPTKDCEDQELVPCEHGRQVSRTIGRWYEFVPPEGTQPSETNPGTSRDESKAGADNTYFIIMIVTSITSAVALTLLLVFAIRHGCWINNPQSIPLISLISPTNPNPFYENVLFRKECQQQIEELEQREYDVVHPESQYAVANNCQ